MVYAGLALGGSSSFRPARPDLLLDGEDDRERATLARYAQCARAHRQGWPPTAARFAYARWRDNLGLRLTTGRERRPAQVDLGAALARCYDQMSDDGVRRLLAA